MTLSFEMNYDELQIYLDLEGLELLIRKLEILKRQGLPAHDHLQTKSWGGNELTNELHAEGNELINQIRIVKVG